jgi:acetyl/propionyl-CoA carboxylase alpha subunit
MLAKVIAHAPTRVEAVERLARALAGTRVHGVRTNIPALLEVLRHPEFVAGRFDTHFIGTQVVLGGPVSAAEQDADRVHAVAAALWGQERRRAEATVLREIPSGWRNNPSQPQQVAFRSGDRTIVVSTVCDRPSGSMSWSTAPHGRHIGREATGSLLLVDGCRRYQMVRATMCRATARSVAQAA